MRSRKHARKPVLKLTVVMSRLAIAPKAQSYRETRILHTQLAAVMSRLVFAFDHSAKLRPCVCVYVYVCVCVCVCKCVCVCVRARELTHRHARARTHTH